MSAPGEIDLTAGRAGWSRGSGDDRSPSGEVLCLEPSACGQRIDHAIQRALEAGGRPVSSREVRRALREGRIRVDGRRRAPGERCGGGERVALGDFVPRAAAVVPPDPALLERAPVLHLDAHLLALAKPSGVPTAPLRSGEGGTLLGAAIARCPEVATAGPPLEGGLLHRLDGETSGVVLFARDLETRERLRAAFGAHAIAKRYLAVVCDPGGKLAVGAALVIDGAIAPGSDRQRVRVVAPGVAGVAGALAARTAVQVLGRCSGGLAVVAADTTTGRRHQVRAHLASAGTPIAADALYGAPAVEGGPPRLALHAARLVLPAGLVLEAPVPADLAPWLL